MSAPSTQDPGSTTLGGPDGARAQDRLAWLLLGAALFLGLLRFVRLGRWSLWLDEVFTWGDAHSGLQGNYNDAGYFLIRWTVGLLGGDPTEAALRAFPAFVGYLAIPLTWWAFRTLAGERRAALAALLVAVSAWQLQWSQTARFYTFVEASSLVGVGVALRGVAASRWPMIAAGIAIVGAGIVFQLQAAVVAAALGVCALLVSPFVAPGGRRPTAIAVLLFAVPGLAVSPRVLGAWMTYAAAKPVDDPIGGVAHFALSTGSFLTPALGAMAIAGLLIALVERDRHGLFVASVPALSFVALAAMAATATVSAQYAFALFPWVALLAAWPVDSRTLGQRPVVAFAWAVVAALPLLAGSALYLGVHQGQRARWKEAVALVEARRAPTDVVVGMPATVVEFYLTGGLETDVRKNDIVVDLDRHQPRSFEPWARSGRRMWLVLRTDYMNALASKDRAHLRAFLQEECRLVERFPVLVEGRDLSIEVWTGPE